MNNIIAQRIFKAIRAIDPSGLSKCTANYISFKGELIIINNHNFTNNTSNFSNNPNNTSNFSNTSNDISNFSNTSNDISNFSNTDIGPFNL
jgi:hypothetical protein